ncbi:hypothetical protein MHM_04680 [Candidatus Mycoplasma haemominutum 'Birmingham 1']|uniref:Uncharacterized protein n=1 Tax=Candidatus Mycoplasma haematominutum 'Birmingham 1' TaxID=1116213 RepID=G8C3T8_9MOLU|nr:hypothetical protein MHM_04680 [Candidatus Mycoplasma haematominutum 'Birmingham 1']
MSLATVNARLLTNSLFMSQPALLLPAAVLAGGGRCNRPCTLWTYARLSYYLQNFCMGTSTAIIFYFLEGRQ